MNNEHLKPEAELIYNLISVVGAMTTTQAETIIEGYYNNVNASREIGIINGKYVKEKKLFPDTCEQILKHLCRTRRTKIIDEKYHIPFYKNEVDTKKLPSLWVLLDLATNEYGCDPSLLQQVVEGNGIIDFSYIQDEQIIVNVIYVLPTDKSKVIASKQRFYDYTGCSKGEEKNQKIAYIYVTESLEAADMVNNENIAFHHKIALVQGDLTEHPTVRYI